MSSRPGVHDRVRAQLRQRLRRAAASAGLDVRRVDHGWRRTLPEVLRHYVRLGLEARTIVDVGVASGTPLLYEGLPDARLLLIEPLEEWRGAMEEIARSRPTDITIAAAGARAGTMELGVTRGLFTASKFAGQPDGVLATTRTVPVVTVDDVVARVRPPSPFVLKVDVEGAELEVLAGAQQTLGQSEIVLLEVALFELDPGRPVLHDIIARMHELGWVASELYDAHNRTLDGSLAMLDIAFVREDGRFRRDSRYGTPAQTEALYATWGF